MKVLFTQLCLTLCNSLDYSPTGSSVHGILQARVLEWVAMPSSRGYSQPRDQTRVSFIAGRFLTIWATREAHIQHKTSKFPALRLTYLHFLHDTTVLIWTRPRQGWWRQSVHHSYRQNWFINNSLTHIIVPLFNFKTRSVTIPYDKHIPPAHILRNNTLSLFSVISTATVTNVTSSIQKKKKKKAEYQPRSTNLWIEFKQIITNVEITDKTKTVVKHTYACHTHTFTTRKIFEASYVFPGGGQGGILQYSCLENPTDRGAWRATVHELTKSWTRLSD